VAIVDAQVNAAVLVDEKQLTAVTVVGILDVKVRVAHVRELEQELLFDLLELASGDFVAIVTRRPLEREQLLLERELWRQELVDEGNVVVKRPHLEHLLTTETEP